MFSCQTPGGISLSYNYIMFLSPKAVILSSRISRARASRSLFRKNKSFIFKFVKNETNNGANRFTMDYTTALHTLGVFASGIFAGGALSTSVVQHPSLSETLKSDHEFLAHFQSFFPRAAKLQGSLALLSSFSLLASYYLDATRDWKKLAAGLLMGSIFPFTMGFMMPVNNQFTKALTGSTPTQPYTALFSTWGKLHWVRTIASIVAFGISVWKQ